MTLHANLDVPERRAGGLQAEVLNDWGDMLGVRARHGFYLKSRDRLISRGEEFDVPRSTVFAVRIRR